jgi:hypothetical protein
MGEEHFNADSSVMQLRLALVEALISRFNFAVCQPVKMDVGFGLRQRALMAFSHVSLFLKSPP